MSISSDEVNFLVYKYLQESGFVHSAFTFAYESLVAKSSVAHADVPPGALITFLQKGLQYVTIEAHLNEDGTERPCEEDVTLVSAHLCHGTKSKPDKPQGGQKKRQKKNNGTSSSPAETDEPSPKRKEPSASESPPKTIQAVRDGISREEPVPVIATPNNSISSVNVPENEVCILRGHSSEVFTCAWNPHEDILASGSGDSTARLWDVSRSNGSGNSLQLSVLQHSSTASLADGKVSKNSESKSVSPIKDGYSNSTASAAGSESAAGGSVKNTEVTTLEWNSSGTLLATGSYDGQGRIWTKTGDLVRTLIRHDGPIFSLKWNKSGSYILSGSYDKTAVVWDASTGDVKQQFALHHAPTLDVDWQNDNAFATCSTDRMIHLCSIGEEKPVRTFRGHNDEVNAIKWNPNGSLLASCSDDFTVKIWHPKQDTPAYDFKEHGREIYTIKWSPTGPGTDYPNKSLWLASASFDASIKIWDVDAGKSIHTLSRHNDPVYSVAFSPDGDFLASGALCGLLHIWSVKDGSLVKTYRGEGDIFEVCWNSTGNKVAACFSNSNMCVVDFRK